MCTGGEKGRRVRNGDEVEEKAKEKFKKHSLRGNVDK